MAQEGKMGNGVSRVLGSFVTFLLGSPEGTIREPFITPKEAVEKNKSIIKEIIGNTKFQDSSPDSGEST